MHPTWLSRNEKPIASDFPCTGRHGGRLYLRLDCRSLLLLNQVTARPAAPTELLEIEGDLRTFCDLFQRNPAEIMQGPFTVITPDSKNPYQQMYVMN